MNSPTPEEILERISTYPDAEKSIRYAEKNCYGSTYLVGGKVYRTIVEMVTDKDVGAAKADWDFLCMGNIRNVESAPCGWVNSSPGASYGYGRRSRSIKRVHRTSRRTASKIDLVSMSDVMDKVGFPNSTDIGDYLKAVPLDIQAIAIGPMPKAVLHGPKAIDAIRMRRVTVNNMSGKIDATVPMEAYIAAKASSLGFLYAGIEAELKVPCNCFPGDTRMLWARGCQAPGLHN